jgi:hypothetical protein
MASAGLRFVTMNEKQCPFAAFTTLSLSLGGAACSAGAGRPVNDDVLRFCHPFLFSLAWLFGSVILCFCFFLCVWVLKAICVCTCIEWSLSHGKNKHYGVAISQLESCRAFWQLMAIVKGAIVGKEVNKVLWGFRVNPRLNSG